MIRLSDLPRDEQDGALRAALLHRRAQKISNNAKITFARFAANQPVTLADLTDAIVEGMHADVTRLGQSAARRTNADPLLILWKVVSGLDLADSVPERVIVREVEVAVEDQETAALLRYARSIMTTEQRVGLAHFAEGYRQGVAAQ